MGGGMASQSFEGFGQGEKFTDLGIGLGSLVQSGLSGHRPIQRDPERIGNQFGQTIRLGVGEFQDPSHIADHGLGLKRPEGDDLTDMV